jgi:hypothetical protein
MVRGQNNLSMERVFYGGYVEKSTSNYPEIRSEVIKLNVFNAIKRK